MTSAHSRTTDPTETGAVAPDRRPRLDTTRRGTETKPAFKTTEFFVYVAAVVAVLVASLLVGTTDAHEDYFRADQAWLYVVLLSIAYIVSRGVAKSGTRTTTVDRHAGN